MNLDSTFHRSPKNALKYYYITSFIGLIVVLVILSILYYCWSTYNWWNFILYILITVAVISVINFIVGPFLRYKYHFYKFEGDSIILKQAFFFKKVELSKIERLQYITVSTNPIAKIFKINTIELVTAGHEISLPMVSEKEADVIEHQALNRLRGVDDDV